MARLGLRPGPRLIGGALDHLDPIAEGVCQVGAPAALEPLLIGHGIAALAAAFEELRKAGAKYIFLKTGAYRPADLARALVRFGAVSAMELDINSYWVSFITYGTPGAGAPTNMLPDMERADTRYLEPDDRDFFAVYAR